MAGGNYILLTTQLKMDHKLYPPKKKEKKNELIHLWCCTDQERLNMIHMLDSDW